MKKAKLLRKFLAEQPMVRIVGAHNGMSAKLVESAGFEGVWASGLEISTAHAVPDANILTMSDYLRVATYINDAVQIPVIVDADTGYGNSNNVMYMVKKFEAAGIAAVCIEDKMFPKVNSFVPGRQELAPMAEFVGKIMAAKNAQEEEDFMVIARVEALIAGWGEEEALKRARAYAKAGADAIFIHSKSKDPGEIESFVKAWEEPTPLVVCPTTYPQLTVDEAQKSGKIKVYIFANHGIRSAVQAMQNTFGQLAQSGDIRSVEQNIAAMKEIFELQGMPQMKAHEKKYLMSEKDAQVIIPAAGVNREAPLLKELLKDRPVAMLDINGKSVLQRNAEIFNQLGIQDIVAIGGHEKEKIDVEGIEVITNPQYQDKGIAHSILCAREKLRKKTIVLFGDVLFEKQIAERLLQRDEDVVLVIDRSYEKDVCKKSKVDLVQTQAPPLKGERELASEENNPVLKIGQNLSPDEATHEFIGLVMFSATGIQTLKEIYQQLEQQPPNGPFHEAADFSQADLTDLLQEMIDRGHLVSSLEVNKGWLELHSFDNYKRACKIFGG